jgi:hypothetical protein
VFDAWDAEASRARACGLGFCSLIDSAVPAIFDGDMTDDIALLPNVTLGAAS